MAGARKQAASGEQAAASGLGYGSISPYQRLAAGRYAVSIRAAGAAPTTPPVLTMAVQVSAGQAQTVALDGRFADARLDALPDDLSPPPPGQARVRVVAAAEAAPAVDVAVAGGPLLASGLPFGRAAEPVTLTGGTRTLQLSSGGWHGGVDADLPAGAVLTVLVVDAPEGYPTVLVHVDAAGPAVAPAGGVDAGEGGTASALPIRWTAALAGRVPATAQRVAAAAAAAHAQPGPAEPVRLRVASAGVDAPVRGVGLDPAGVLAAPADPRAAGWLVTGPEPGAAGAAVVAGHVDSADGPAVFFRLPWLQPGDPVEVVRADGGVVRFVVVRVARYPKAALPTAEVYGPTPGPELRLITCGGRFDPAMRSYADNVVVFAHVVR